MRTILLLRCKHGLKGVKRGFDWHNDWHTTVSIKSIKDVSCLFVRACADRITAKAERAGFEPAVRCYSYADLANRCFRPLSHLSVHLNLLKSIQ